MIADSIKLYPVFNAILEKDSLASQPTLSRFFNRMDEDMLLQFDDICLALTVIRKVKASTFIIRHMDSSGCPYKKEFYRTLENIQLLKCTDGITTINEP